jgi:hypothetical protein
LSIEDLLAENDGVRSGQRLHESGEFRCYFCSGIIKFEAGHATIQTCPHCFQPNGLPGSSDAEIYEEMRNMNIISNPKPQPDSVEALLKNPLGDVPQTRPPSQSPNNETDPLAGVQVPEELRERHHKPDPTPEQIQAVLSYLAKRTQ